MARHFIEPLFKGDRVAPLLRWRRGPLVGIPLALVLCGATVLLRLALDQYLNVPAIFIFGPAVVFSTLFGGLAAGIVAVVLSTLASWYFFLAPVHSWTLSPDTLLALLVFVIVFGADVALIELVIRAYRSIQSERRRMSVALRAASMGLWRGHAGTGRRQWSAETYEMFDYARDDPRHITALTDFVHPDDKERYSRTMTQVLADPSCDEYDVEYRIIRRDGDIRWLRSRARITRRADGTAEWMDGGVIDITRQKSTEQHLQLLLFELQHRIKNFHAVVQAIANRTLPSGGEMKASRELFLNRLLALSRANIMLVHQENTGLWLADILKEELGAFSEQIDIEGCRILLKPNVAQSFALAVHELATNAIKYGALSSPDGRVLLSGAIDGETGRYRFSWRESGGAKAEPPAREGYGRSLLANLSEGLGRAEWNLTPEGLRFDLSCDLRNLVPPNQPDVPAGQVAGLAR